jgi:hypothetical protein
LAAAGYREGEVNDPIKRRKALNVKTTHTLNRLAAVLACALAFTTATPIAQAQSHYENLAGLPFTEGYIPKGDVPTLLDESFFERAVQTYLWAVPALNMYGMKAEAGVLRPDMEAQ